jgi:hypothetical protein
VSVTIACEFAGNPGVSIELPDDAGIPRRFGVYTIAEHALGRTLEPPPTTARLRVHMEHCADLHLVDVETAGLAGLGDRALAAAAEVDCVLLKDANGRGQRGRDLRNGRVSRDLHRMCSFHGRI